MKNRDKIIREILKNIPSVDQLIEYCNKSIDVKLPHNLVKNLIRKKIKLIRQLIIDGQIDNNISEYCFNDVLKEIESNNNF